MKNSSSNVRHNKVLILGAICVSIVAGVVSYRIADIQNQREIEKKAKISDDFKITGDIIDPVTNKILSAIDNSNPIFDDGSVADDPFTITDKDSATARLAKQVYSDYINKEAGNSDLEVADIAQNALSQLSTADMPSPAYNLSAVSFTSGQSGEEIRLYGNNFAEIYTRNLNNIAKNQQKYSENLLAIADVYENISKELIKIKVPPQISTSHLAIANNYHIMAESFRLINAQTKDPVKSLLGVKASKEAEDDNTLMFTNISNYFKDNGIVFSDNEIGSIWNIN
ncbi:MAG: hypothetical protein WCO09_01250 [bacterium]